MRKISLHTVDRDALLPARMTAERRKPYPFDEIEAKWQRYWDEHQTFHALNPGEPGFDASKPKYYVLDMFPYPSGAGLHVGHAEGYTATDILTRYKRMRGFNVLHPMGWDAFGLPAEQHAIKTGEHPSIQTRKNTENFRRQLKAIGFTYDWQREVNTTDPGYYRWTQWIFLRLYNSWCNPATGKTEPIETYTGEDPDSVRLAFVSEAPVNWSPDLGTVLANEEVDEWRAKGHTVERRPLRQWMLRITAYAQRLVDELEGLDWPESIKVKQRNWIGRSEGAEVHFRLADADAADQSAVITVFTTRPDTLYGATYMVVAPEHALVERITSEAQRRAVEEYREGAARKSELERTELAKEKSGVFTGGFAINPVSGERIPIWIADYVLAGYGTGAIMAVPAHDERDWEFAQKFALPIRAVVAPEQTVEAADSACATEPAECFAGAGYAINSPLNAGENDERPVLNGLSTADAKQTITAWLEARGQGRGTVNYKLRDWLFSRQRYWGEPFPIVWEGGRHRALPDDALPVTLPEMADFKPTGTPEPPLSKATDWVRYSETALRETNTMPQWAGSCWYYLRYIDPENATRFVSAEAERYWMGNGHGGVDLYIGGTEHAVLHLLYARFWHKVLFDYGLVSTPEPFQKLVNQGLILGEDGRKMSKSFGNVANPDDVIAAFGADSLRCFEMFMGPLEQSQPWSTAGVEGVLRFLARVWRLAMEETQAGDWTVGAVAADAPLDKASLKLVHATIKKVTEDFEALSFNTAISQMMIFVNHFTGVSPRPAAALRVLLQLLNPVAPHLTEELWERLGFGGIVADQPWPAWDEKHLIEDEVELAVQINGKVRDKLVVAKDATREAVEAAALSSPKIQDWTAGKTVKKVVVVPGKIVNIVTVQ